MIYRNKEQLIRSCIHKTDVVLDVGFWGQGITHEEENWPHTILKKNAQEVYGIDVDLRNSFLNDPHYIQSSAEDFYFPVKFDVIFAGDLIEHLSNPGLFLESCRRNLKEDGRLVLTTPNTFNLFNITEKITKNEPTVNSDHTCYFNSKTLRTLLRKNNFLLKEVNYIYSLEIDFKESLKKKILNILYSLLSHVTDKFIETLVIVAVVSDDKK